jgi:NAD(P)-dependent dehydrogenase (short-subunit alcohol dehydrogenase family)
MDLNDKAVVVTGGGNGIGKALAERLAAEGARGVTIADINEEWAHYVAGRITASGVPAVAVGCDVGDPDAVGRLVDTAVEAHGPIDVFVSNAGYSDKAPGDLTPSPEAWRKIVDVNLLAHVWAAQRVVPGMIERGEGYLMQTISSAALITGPSAPGYTLTKHGALGFAEWLTLNHGHQGLRVSCLCPNVVHTGMFGRRPEDEVTDVPDVGGLGEVLTPESVADTVVATMRGDVSFLILPHARVRDSFRRKAEDYDAWLTKTRQRVLRIREEQQQG